MVSDWTQVAWPVTLTVGGGALLFANAIVDSIRSTPHPSLVYIIFGALAIAVLSTWRVLLQLHREEQIARRWNTLEPTRFANELLRVHRGSSFRDAYALLTEQSHGLVGKDRRELERRLNAAERAYSERLSFPGFIAGGLVGLGLVGTFIGLLGALNELAQLFSGMTGGAGTDPIAMLGGMMSKLQAPMKSMGTAFIASLYGLLGSLVLGSTLVAINKIRHRVTANVHDVLLNALDRAITAADTVPTLPRLPEESEAEHARWTAVLGALQRLHDQHQAGVISAQAPIARVEQAIDRLHDCLASPSATASPDRTPLWLDLWSQLQEQLGVMRAHEESSSRAILHALQAQQQSMQRLVELTSSAREHDQAIAGERDLRDASLHQSLQDCRLAFEDISGRLRGILLFLEAPTRQEASPLQVTGMTSR